MFTGDAGRGHEPGGESSATEERVYTGFEASLAMSRPRHRCCSGRCWMVVDAL
jgi:hypothetical protein